MEKANLVFADADDINLLGDCLNTIKRKYIFKL
jgi:hypothetical protein